MPVDLRLLRVVGPQLDEALPFLLRVTMGGFALAIASGVLLVSVRIRDYIENPAFLAKMAIVLAAGANALLLRIVSGERDVVAHSERLSGRLAGAASLSLWIAAIFAGRWIAFS